MVMMSDSQPQDALPRGYGQVAYEEYARASDGRSLISGAPLPRWDEQSLDARYAWDRAAAAVAEYVSRVP